METLQNLVRNLAIILLIATFLEMLLPKNSMRSYVQLVMGLFVISAVLSPISTFLKFPIDMEIPAWTSASQQDMPVLANQGSAIGQNAVQEQYRKILVNQIRALAIGVSGVQEANVDIQFKGKEGGITDQPEIELVKIILVPGKQGIEPIKPIIIGTGIEEQANHTSNLTEEVKEKVSAFIQIPKEKILVSEQL